MDSWLVQQIKDIPDYGWSDSYGEDTYLEIAETMVKAGLGVEQAALLLQRLYWATRNEFH